MVLNQLGWSDPARARLEKLISAGTGKGLPVVFDFDNTIVCGDIGEATMALMAQEGTIRKEDIPPALAPPFIGRDGKEVSLSVCADIAAFYEALLAAFVQQGGDPAPLSNGYVWAAEIMQGLTALDVVRATEKVHAMNEPYTEKLIEASPGGNAYPVPFFYPEMVELIAALLDGGYDVWIVSASNVWTVRWMVLNALNRELSSFGCGRGITPDRVVGVSTLINDRNGGLCKDTILVKSDRRYAEMDEERLAGCSLTAMLNFPVPVYSGKVANIIDLIGKPPYLAAGDSPGDLPMLAFSENRLWIARLEKPGYQKEMSALAARAGGTWIAQPVLCTGGPGFISDTEKAGALFYGSATAAITESVKVLRKLR